MTSHDVVNRVRRATGERRVGHAGTLDPMATGLLVVLVGPATRLAPYLTAAEKTYDGAHRLRHRDRHRRRRGRGHRVPRRARRASCDPFAAAVTSRRSSGSTSRCRRRSRRSSAAG